MSLPQREGMPLSRKSILFASAAVLVMADGDYPLYPALTEELDFICFSQVIPGFFTPFEILSYLICLFTLSSARGRGRQRPAMSSKECHLLLVIGTILLSVMLLAAFLGIMSHGEGRIAFWQLRSIPLLLSWALISFFTLESTRDATKFLNIFTAFVLIKMVQNLFVFLVGHGGVLPAEYLSSHIGSLYMGTALYRLAIAFFYETRGRKRVAAFMAFSFVFYIWLVNDRRISFIGIVFSLIFAMIFLLPHLKKWHFMALGGAAGGTAFGLSALLASGSNSGIAGLFIAAPKGLPDYRDIENYNLYRAVAEFPLLGRGFGFPFKQYMELPDIFRYGETLLWIPHNNILMLWANSGPLGLAGLGLMISFSIAGMVRLFNIAPARETKIFAFISFGVFVQWTLYIWADMALTWSPSMLLPGVVAGFVFKLLYLEKRAGTPAKIARAG